MEWIYLRLVLTGVGTFDYLKAFCKVVYLDRTPNISSTMLRGSNYKITKMGISWNRAVLQKGLLPRQGMQVVLLLQVL